MEITELVALITQVITALTAVIALLLIVKQMRQLDKTLRSQVYQGLIDNSLKIDQLLMEKPEFRKYVYGGEKVNENTPDIDRIMSMTEFMVDVVDNVKAQEAIIPKAEKPGWSHFTQHVVRSPAAQYFMQKHGLWFSGSVPQIIEEKAPVDLKQRIRKLLHNLGDSRRKKLAVKSYVSLTITIHNSKIHGSGMFAKTNIRKGDIVFIKGGYILTRNELFSSEKIGSYLPIDDNYFIGSRSKDEEIGIKLFVNHSCEPNCGLRGEITFVAMRDVLKDEELTCDYAMIDNDDYEFICNCGSASCRKLVTGHDWKIKDIQRKYSGFFTRYLVDKINQHTDR
jgi:uncharacterized protein